MKVEGEYKKKNKRLTISLEIVSLLTFIFAALFGYQYLQYQTDSNVQATIDLRNKLTVAQDTINHLQQANSNYSKEGGVLNDQVSSLNNQVASLNQQISTLNKELAEDGQTINQLRLSAVTLSGVVTTSGYASYPKTINFEANGIRHTAKVNGTNGYTIKLDNYQTYVVTIDWGTLAQQANMGGNAAARESPFNLQSTSTSMTNNFSG